MNEFDVHKNSNIFAEISSYEKVKRLLDFKNSQRLQILDVGCSNGNLCRDLAALGHDLTGIDAKEAERAENFNFIAADITEAWPLPNQTFDLAICTDVAEHLYDPLHVLQEAERVLKPGGRLIFGVPNHFDLRQRSRMLFGKGIVHWDNLRHNQTAWSYVHIRFFTLPELLEMFKQSGWGVEKIQLNFMGGGIVPTSFTPGFFRTLLLKLWPNLFSGKFIFLLKKNFNQKPKIIYLNKTPQGM